MLDGGSPELDRKAKDPPEPVRISGAFDEQFFTTSQNVKNQGLMVAICTVILLVLLIGVVISLFFPTRSTTPVRSRKDHATEFAETLALPVEGVYCAGNDCTLKLESGKLMHIICTEEGCRPAGDSE